MKDKIIKLISTAIVIIIQLIIIFNIRMLENFALIIGSLVLTLSIGFLLIKIYNGINRYVKTFVQALTIGSSFTLISYLGFLVWLAYKLK